MSTFNIFIILIILVVIILLLLAAILVLNKGKNKNTISKKESKNNDIPLPDIKSLLLPANIEKIPSFELLGIVRKVYESYKYFDYKNMDHMIYEKKEWHTWQVSLLIMLFKKDEEFFIPNQEQFFHNTLLNSNENSIKGLMGDILKKYKNYVDINAGKDSLCKEYIWSNKEVSTIFYFLANYKNYKNNI